MRGYRGLDRQRRASCIRSWRSARINVQANRGNEYSFDIAEGYYIENSLTLSYTQRLFGDVDASVTGSKSNFDYGFTERSPARQDKLDSVVGRGRL